MDNTENSVFFEMRIIHDIIARPIYITDISIDSQKNALYEAS